MLHLRDRIALPAPWQWLGASDPGLLRLQMAARGTLAVAASAIVCIVVAGRLGVTPIEFANGILFSMMAPFLMREPTLRQRRRTLLLLAIPAVLAAVVAALLHDHPRIGAALLLAVVFVGSLLQARSPRGIGLGLIAIVGLYVGLFLHLPPATLPAQMLSIALAVPLTALACFAVIPMRPAWTLRRTIQAVQARAAAAAAAGAGLSRRLALARLNEAALAADDQLALLDPADGTGIRHQLVALELAVVQTVETDDASVAELARAAASLDAARIRPTAFDGSAPAPLPPGPLAWRVALRVTLASALAMAGGMALSEQRWFWAVITAYVVFLGTRSRGDTTVKGAQRLGGTLLGLAAGLVLANLAGSDPVLITGGLLLATFGMYYTFLVSYTQGILCVTVLLGLLYGAMGATLGPLLLLRLEETAIGTAAAILVAQLVLPVRTREQVTRSGRAVLGGVAEVVRCSRLAWSGEPGPGPLLAVRALDRQVADLRLALVPLRVGQTLLRRPALERPVPALLDCVHLARLLAVGSTPGAFPPEAAARAAAIEARLTMLAANPAALPDATEACGADDLLNHLDQAITVLAERLALRVHDGFALEG